MRYFVIGDDGQKYGPADVSTLQAWVGEARLLPNQQVEEEGSGIRMAAAAVNGLNFPDLAPPEPRMATPGPAFRGPAGGPVSAPTGSPYDRPAGTQVVSDDGKNDVILAWVFTVIGFLSCCFLAELAGLFFGNRAVSKGNFGGGLPKTLSIVVLVLHILGYIAYIILAVMFVKQGIVPAGTVPIRGQ